MIFEQSERISNLFKHILPVIAGCATQPLLQHRDAALGQVCAAFENIVEGSQFDLTFCTMVSLDPSPAAAGTPRPPTHTAPRKREADDDAAGESKAAKKTAISGRGQLTMRRSGTPASFHGLARPSIPAGQSALVPRHVPRPGPLSLPTPASFNFPHAKSSTIGSQAISPTSSSTSSFTSAPSSIESFQLSAEVRQSLSRPAHEAPTTKSSEAKGSGPAVVMPRFIPQFGPAHRLPPESEDEDDKISAANSHAIVQIPKKPQNFEERLARAQEQSQVWQYIKDKLDSSRVTCRSEREQEALLEILRLPRQNVLDDEPMRKTDKHKRRYCVIMGSILQVVGVKGHCDACGPHSRVHWAHREKTCTGLPPEASGPRYRNLVALVAGRCSNCIRSNYNTWVCHFSAGQAPSDAGEDNAPDTASDDKPGDSSSKGRVHVPGVRNPTPKHRSRTPAPGAKADRPPPPAGPGPRAQTSAAPEESAEAVIRDAILIGFRASAQLQDQEQREFHGWMTALFSSSAPSAPDLEGQAIEALVRLRRLPAGAQADIRRRILQMLPGAMGRPA